MRSGIYQNLDHRSEICQYDFGFRKLKATLRRYGYAKRLKLTKLGTRKEVR